jgi:hypothetical protein
MTGLPTLPLRFFYFEFFPLFRQSSTSITASGAIASIEGNSLAPGDEVAVPGETVGARFPDDIELLTRNLRGSVFVMISPKDLASGVQKVREETGPKDGAR